MCRNMSNLTRIIKISNGEGFFPHPLIPLLYNLQNYVVDLKEGSWSMIYLYRVQDLDKSWLRIIWTLPQGKVLNLNL